MRVIVVYSLSTEQSNIPSYLNFTLLRNIGQYLIYLVAKIEPDRWGIWFPDNMQEIDKVVIFFRYGK